MFDRSSVAGTVLGALRSARGVNQEVIGDACKRSKSYISDWERGRTDIPGYAIQIYSAQLNIPEREILDLIHHWQQEDDKNPAFQGNTYTYPLFRTRIAKIIEDQYEQEPLNPRTRRDFGRKGMDRDF